MFLPYSVDVPMERMPIANWALIGVTTIVSLVITVGTWQRGLGSGRLDDFDPEVKRQIEQLEQQGEQDRTDVQLARIMARRKAPPLALVPQGFLFLQLFSYQFVHSDILHLIGNMIFLFVFGNAVNAKLGHGAFLASYLLLGAMGGIAWLVFGTGDPLVGASGSIMGIVGIFVVLFPRNDVTVMILWRSGGSFQLSAYFVIGAYIILDLLGTLQEGQGIAYVAHLSGEVLGMAAGVGMVLFGFVRSSPDEQNLLELFGWKKTTERSVAKSAPRKKGTAR